MLTCSVISTQAQNFETAYFLDNYSYSFRINPAMQNDKNLVSALIGNFEIYTGSNAGMSNFIFPRNGQLVSGLNEQVSAQEFLGSLNSMSDVNAAIAYTLGTAGFRTSEKVYHTIDLTIKAYTEGTIPKELFEFAKVGGPRTYDITGTDVTVNSYAEIAYGYSRAINSKVKVGGRLKFLAGLGQIDVKANNLSVSNSTNGVLTVTSDAILTAAQSAITIPVKEDGTYDLNAVKFDGKNFGVPGFGFGIDLGVTYEPIEGLVTSLAINDLGGISWKQNISGSAAGLVQLKDLTSKEVEEVGKRFEELVKFKPTGETSRFIMLPFTVNAGARYAMPFYRKFSAGLDFIYKNYTTSYFNARAGATITPVDWFSFTMNYGYGTLGSSFGGAFSISGGIFNFYLGAETYLGKRMSDIPAPVGKFRTAVNFGINFRI